MLRHRAATQLLRSRSPTITATTMTSAYAAMSNTAVSTLPATTKPAYHTVTSLKRWRCNAEDPDLPPVSSIKAIHVYDFDNTLFASPTPNKALWNGQTLGQLASPDILINGGWWHDSSILASTGEGVDKEEQRAWSGWWNEQIVALVELTMQQKDALNVLLTGRSESGFAGLVNRIVKSKNLKFDMVCLKPSIGPAGQTFKSTMLFKQELLKDIVYTYKDAEEIRIYEDRVKHTKGFRDFFFQFNKDLMNNQLPTTRKPFIAEVVQVAENAKVLDPATEVAVIQRMVNRHNKKILDGTAPPNATPMQIKKTVFYTGYMIPSAMTEKLISLVKLQQNAPEGDIKYLANNILITPKPCPKTILEKVGGIGSKMTWKVTGVSCFENKLWAARVEPVPKNANYYSENKTPTVVLAIRKNGRPADATRISNWHPVSDEQAYTFETVVSEKKLLRIEEERRDESEWESAFPNKHLGKRAREDSPGQHGPSHREFRSQDYRTNNRGAPNGPANHRGGGNRGRGNRNFLNARGRGNRGGGGGGGGGPNRGRGRGGQNQSQYRSLDDVGDSRSYNQPNYGDDAPGYY